MDDDKLIELLSQSSRSFISRHTIKNAITPICVICGLATPPCFTAAYFLREDNFLKYLLVIMGILVILVSIGSYVYLLLKKPAMLQSEEYQLRNEVLQMVMKRGGKFEVLPLDLPAIANPPPLQIEHKEEDKS